MSKDILPSNTGGEAIEARPPQFLTAQQVAMIDEALNSLGEYGELRLVVEKGRLRFVVTHKSFDANKWMPGTITGKSR